jgi:two-component system, cell cycle sensor histidine kinase and response regulator CckA
MASLQIIDLDSRRRSAPATPGVDLGATLLEQARDPVWAHDLLGVVRYWNRAAERVFGIPASEAIGAPVELLLGYDSTTLAGVHRDLLLHSAFSGELCVKPRDSRRQYINATWSLVCDAAGVPELVLAITKDLGQEGGDLIPASTAHDLNNILTPILAWTAVLRMQERSPEDLEALEGIEVSARRAADFIKQARRSTGR